MSVVPISSGFNARNNNISFQARVVTKLGSKKIMSLRDGLEALSPEQRDIYKRATKAAKTYFSDKKGRVRPTVMGYKLEDVEKFGFSRKVRKFFNNTCFCYELSDNSGVSAKDFSKILKKLGKEVVSVKN